MGTLLLVTIPLAVALFASAHPQANSRSRAFAMLSIGAGGFLLVLVGLVLNGSLAAVGLALPVVASSSLILPAGWRFRRLAVPAAALVLIVALGALISGPLQWNLAGGVGSKQSRHAIWESTASAVAGTFPVGTGLGSFQQVYPLYEEPATVDNTYINHAHNDYLELLLEAGLLGALLLLLFLLWWVAQVLKVWRSPLSSHYGRAATIASAAILAHSIVDYPLRTAAISAVFAGSLAIMASWTNQRRSSVDVQPAKHLSIG